MYKTIVRRKIRNAFVALSVGDAQALTSAMHPLVHHSFPGDTALGGERANREDVGRWLDRLFRLFPGLTFQVREMSVSGWPWHTVVGVEWSNSGPLLDGSTYDNAGAHILVLRWGRLRSFHAYLHDEQQSAEALRRLAAGGFAEAAAPPIQTLPSAGRPVSPRGRTQVGMTG